MPPTKLPPLEKLDPAEAWKPWQPSAQEPWNHKRAGHLYRRAAFGATLTELRQAVKDGLPATLDRLLRGEPDAADWDPVYAKTGEKAGESDDIAKLRGWWVFVLLNTRHPLRERMTLFWHNHFATSVVKVQRTDLMYKQNQLLRKHALGKFGPFLLEMSKDPAMLIWLDSNSNIKGQANENYAREVMELFSLGVGNYTERDIREAARAFTGWHTSDDKFEFKAALHDDGPKIVFKQKGNWNGDDIIRLLLQRDVAARFLVRKLYREFVSETSDPPDSFLEPLAAAFRKNDYDVAGLMKAILGSRHFFSDYAYRQRVKSPVEFAIGAIHTLVPKVRDEFGLKYDIAPPALVPPLEAMGQPLFAPPNVKGWPGGRTWLNTATVLARHNYAQTVASGRWGGGPGGPPFAVAVPEPPPPPGGSAPRPEEPPPPPGRDTAAVLRAEKVTDPARAVDLVLDLLLQGGVPRASRDQLVTFVAEAKPKDSKQKDPRPFERRARAAIATVLCMPEYQLA